MPEKTCQCESTLCKTHDGANCKDTPEIVVKTVFGSFNMCAKCFAALPDEYIVELESYKEQK